MINQAKILVKYIDALPGFKIATEIDGNYQNMGATIIDGILQAEIKYKTTVKPRVNTFLSEYPEITTTKKFKSLIDRVSVSKLINWKESSKTRIIQNLTEFLIKENVDTECEFKEWLKHDNNVEKLKQISGIKDKTADYFKILTGHNTNAIDRHLIGFLENAGIQIGNYQEAQSIISETAKLLDIHESYFDHSLWKYMSESKEDNLKKVHSQKSLKSTTRCKKIK
jgi:3-methyladenine DNA glycosylase/8-oxoguanine DNA glycosylase